MSDPSRPDGTPPAPPLPPTTPSEPIAPPIPTERPSPQEPLTPAEPPVPTPVEPTVPLPAEPGPPSPSEPIAPGPAEPTAPTFHTSPYRPANVPPVNPYAQTQPQVGQGGTFPGQPAQAPYPAPGYPSVPQHQSWPPQPGAAPGYSQAPAPQPMFAPAGYPQQPVHGTGGVNEPTPAYAGQAGYVGQPGYPQGGYADQTLTYPAYPGAAPAPQKSRTPKKGLWGVILGTIGVVGGVIFGWTLPLSIAAVVLGFIARKREQDRPGRALAAIVTGVVGVLLSLGWLAYSFVTIASRAAG